MPFTAIGMYPESPHLTIPFSQFGSRIIELALAVPGLVLSVSVRTPMACVRARA